MIKHYQTRDPQSKLVSKEVQGHVDRRDLVLNKAYMLKGNSLKYMQLKKKEALSGHQYEGGFHCLPGKSAPLSIHLKQLFKCT